MLPSLTMENLPLAVGLSLWVIVSTSVVGDRCLRPLNLSWANPTQRFVFGSVLGLGLWLLALFFAGWLISFTRLVACGVMVIFTVPTIFYARESFTSGNTAGQAQDHFSDAQVRSLARLCGLAIVFCILASFAPVANMADALAYHLNLPKEFIRAEKIQAIPYDINSAFPLLVDVGFGFGLLFRSSVFANLLAVWIGILCAAGVYGWALERSDTKYAWLGTAAFLLTPAVYNHINTPYVDLALALFAFLAFWAFCAWVREGKIAWIVLSGLFCGFALGVKYLALLYVSFVAMAILAQGWRQKIGIKKIAGLLCVFGLCAIVPSFVWYARSWFVMGNPLYPYLSSFFGGKPSLVDWQVVERTYGVGYGFLQLLTLFWDATFYPQAYAGFGTRWNLLFLGLFPLVLWHLAHKKGGWLALFAGMVFLGWFFTSQVMRFLMPFFPLYCVLLAWSAAALENRGKLLRRLVWTWIFAVCLWEMACVAVHAKPRILLHHDKEGWRKFLFKHEPTFTIADYVNSILPSESCIVSDGEVRFYYFLPRMVRERALRLFTDYPQLAKSPAEVAMFFKSQGFTHVLIGERPGEAPPSDRSLRIRNVVDHPKFFQLLHESGYRSAHEIVWYKLYVIL